MSQNQSDKTQETALSATKTETVDAPIIRVGGTLIRKGETITGNPARTKYLGGHMALSKRVVESKRAGDKAQPAPQTAKSKGTQA